MYKKANEVIYSGSMGKLLISWSQLPPEIE